MAAPIVLLHGVGLDHTMWGRVREGLAEHTVLTPDLPGHGSNEPLRREQTLARMASDVLGGLPNEPVHLVGFSLGALIAQYLAASQHDRVVSLTCVSSVFRRSRGQRQAVESRLLAAQNDFGTSAETALQRWFPPESTVPADTVRQVRSVLSRNDVTSYAHAYSVFARGDADAAPMLPSISVRTSIITGALDPGSTPEMSRGLAEAIPGADPAIIVPGARHMLPLERPDAVIGAISNSVGRPHDSQRKARS